MLRKLLVFFLIFTSGTLFSSEIEPQTNIMIRNGEIEGVILIQSYRVTGEVSGVNVRKDKVYWVCSVYGYKKTQMVDEITQGTGSFSDTVYHDYRAFVVGSVPSNWYVNQYKYLPDYQSYFDLFQDKLVGLYPLDPDNNIVPERQPIVAIYDSTGKKVGYIDTSVGTGYGENFSFSPILSPELDYFTPVMDFDNNIKGFVGKDGSWRNYDGSPISALMSYVPVPESGGFRGFQPLFNSGGEVVAWGSSGGDYIYDKNKGTNNSNNTETETNTDTESNVSNEQHNESDTETETNTDSRTETITETNNDYTANTTNNTTNNYNTTNTTNNTSNNYNTTNTTNTTTNSTTNNYSSNIDMGSVPSSPVSPSGGTSDLSEYPSLPEFPSEYGYEGGVLADDGEGGVTMNWEMHFSEVRGKLNEKFKFDSLLDKLKVKERELEPLVLEWSFPQLIDFGIDNFSFTLNFDEFVEFEVFRVLRLILVFLLYFEFLLIILRIFS
jgi:hypothetical protein